VRRFLDTNAYAALKRGDARIEDFVRTAETLFVSIIVLGELYFGFHDGSRFRENLAELERFLAHPFVKVAFLNEASADRFGRIATTLKRAGTPIPTNDIWIAAQCLDHGAELITLDEHHFRKVPGLLIASVSA
jgi:tRNA(fMet)-specific endonuclease VapC